MGIVPTEMELILEQTQQGISHEVSVVTVKIEILPVLTSNSTAVDPHGFEDSYKDGVEVPDSSNCSRQVKIHSRMLILDQQIDEVLKLKTSRKMTIKAFKDQEKYEHVSPKVTSVQDGKSLQVDNKRLCLVDDLKKLKDHLQVKQAQSLKSKSASISHKIKKSRM
ncbi:hypothetical protein Tco_1394252 [Tanacetum coccineum]